MSPEVTSSSHPHVGADLRAAQALLDLSRMLMGVTLRAVAAAPVALTVPQHRVLLTIATDGPRRVGTLADDLGVNQSTASRIVDRLASQGLVHRRRDREDGRASLVELTSEGHDLLDAVREHRLAALLDVVGEPEHDQRAAREIDAGAQAARQCQRYDSRHHDRDGEQIEPASPGNEVEHRSGTFWVGGPSAWTVRRRRQSGFAAPRLRWC